jgi:hypothetical protein
MKFYNLCATGLPIPLLAACSSTETSEAPFAAAEAANLDDVTCKTVVKTATRIGTKVCRTNRA